MKTFTDHFDQIRNYQLFIEEFLYTTKSTHKPVEMGMIDGMPILLFESNTPNEILITSGWQGDEPAGWNTAKIISSKLVNCSFIPIVSPYCFSSRKHRNALEKNIDRGWPEVKTEEGMILNNKIKDIIRLGRKAFISLQEDPKRFVSYFYAWNETNELSDIVTSKLSEHFPLSETPKHVAPDGLFCEYAVQNGCELSIQIETPADGSFPLTKRVNCQVDVVKSIVKTINSSL
jgi:hypothetical protein